MGKKGDESGGKRQIGNQFRNLHTSYVGRHVRYDELKRRAGSPPLHQKDWKEIEREANQYILHLLPMRVAMPRYDALDRRARSALQF